MAHMTHYPTYVTDALHQLDGSDSLTIGSANILIPKKSKKIIIAHMMTCSMSGIVMTIFN